jgi:hypothetical protein
VRRSGWPLDASDAEVQDLEDFIEPACGQRAEAKLHLFLKEHTTQRATG